jgi:hypothetical protein
LHIKEYYVIIKIYWQLNRESRVIYAGIIHFGTHRFRRRQHSHSIPINGDEKADHCQYRASKKKEYVDLMIQWSSTIKKETSFAEKIVNKLDETQTRSLYNQEPFKVSKDIKEKLCEICPYKNNSYCSEKCKDVPIPNDGFTVSGLQLSELRWYIVQYLNSLESIMLAWQQNIVDREMIEEEFLYLYDPARGGNALKKFREIAGGGNSYPVIGEFYKKLVQKKDEKGAKVKEPIGS